MANITPSPISKRLAGESLVLVVLVAWYLYSQRVPEFVMPNPIKVFYLSFRLFVDPRMMSHTYISLIRVLGAVAVAMVLGGVVVLAGRRIPLVEFFVSDRVIPLFNSFPALGWAMLGIIWFGVGNFSVMFVETVILLPFCMINLWEGTKALDPEILEMAKSFTRRKGAVLLKVVIPLLFPYIFAALRVSYGVGWKVSLLTELFGARTGVGYLMNVAREDFDTALIFATIVVIIGLVYAVDKFLFQVIQARIARWGPV